MNELTNQEKAKVFAMYLHCPIKCKYPFCANRNSLKDGKTILSPSILADCWQGTFKFSDFNILITPIELISEEDAIIVAKSWGNLFVDLSTNIKDIAQFGKHQILFGKYLERWEIREILASKGYAVPLFFGLDHWANWKTAIELGLAIDQSVSHLEYQKQ